MKNNWLLRHAPRKAPRARLFCFPYAGAGASAYRLWPKELPDLFDVCAVQLPGREDRLREAPLRSIDRIVEGILPALLPELDLPFAFFGHSMGAIVASEVARALEANGAPMPRHLFVSARRPPHLPPLELPLSSLSDDAFVAELQRRYGGIPAEIAREPELMALLLPSLRADIAALETYRPRSRPPLSCSISAFVGSGDALAPPHDVEEWRAQTSGTFRCRVFDGGHFYLTAHRAALLADIGATLAPLVRPRAGGVPM